MGHLICSGTTTKYLQNLVTGCMVSKSKIQIRLKKKKKSLTNPNQILKQWVEMTSSKEEMQIFFVGVMKVVLTI